MTTRDEELLEAKRIFDRAVELPPTVRAQFVERACSSSATLLEKVKQMLAHFYSESTPLVPPVNNANNQITDFDEDVEFDGTERFLVQRKLGSGGFGTVYEVIDRTCHATVALKVLNKVKPEFLYRFKQEFRALSQVRHENLVRLYELFADRDRWFFTMQFVAGSSFLEYARPQAKTCDFQRVKDTLRQLVSGVQALHGSGHIHRDLKPENVLVTKAGQVVILDFGLVRHLGQNSLRSFSLVGTPAYMSPEQTLQQPLNTSSDWFSVGVMLFQVLTGRLPLSTSSPHPPESHASQGRVEPRTIDPLVPPDLNNLCYQMLDVRPANRPNAEEILLALGERAEGTESSLLEKAAGEIFVGRAEEIESMKAAFVETLSGKVNVALIEGQSGIGKSALVRRFLLEAMKIDPQTIALCGRCHEFESVPYKGLDALIDQLSQYLQRLSYARTQALLPREAFLLRRLFPVLGRVAPIADAPAASDLVPDAQELRQRTFSALREMFARLGDRCPLVIWIDDLQWGDRDSASFLAELCAPPLPPRLLLLITYRTEETESSPTLQYLNRAFASGNKVLRNWRHFSLTGLSDEDSQQLIAKLLEKTPNDKAVRKIVNEAKGHPYYLQELVRGLASGDELPSELAPEDLELSSFLQRRISQLPPFTRELIELISLAGQPLPLSVMFAAATVDHNDSQPDALNFLIRSNLARISGSEGEKRTEPYHDQVRRAVVKMLSPEIRKKRHGQLAMAFRNDPRTEPQTLVAHYRGAGDLEAALEAALMAATTAENQLAFDRAANLYQAAFDTGIVTDSNKAALYQKLADCLAKAGRGWDSAQSYLTAEGCNGSNSLDMRRLAADQLMRSGNVDQGMILYRKLCSNIGIKAPTTPRDAIYGLVYWRLRAWLRFIRGYPKPRRGTVPAENMTRLEVLRTGGVIMNTADPVLAGYFQARHVYEASRTREPLHLATAFAVEASFQASTGPRTPENSFKLIQRAEEIAKSIEGSSNTLGFVYLCRAYVDFTLGRIPQGIENSKFAISFLREHCSGVAWELTAAHVLLFWFTFWAGHADEVRELFPQLLREGATRGDFNVEESLRFLSYYYLSSDQPDECLSQNLRVLESSSDFHLQHFSAFLTCVETYLYLGDYAQARKQLIKSWTPMSTSFLLRWQILRIIAFFLRGRVALACWLRDRSDPALRGEVEYYAKRLKRIRSTWCQPMSGVLIAGLAAGDGDRVSAVLTLEEAHNGFETIPLHGHAAAASYIAGLLRGDEKGLAQTQNAQEFFTTHGFRNPGAFLRLLIPGQWF